MKKFQAVLTATGLAIAVSVLGVMQTDAAPFPVQKTFDVQSSVVQVRDGVRWRGYRGYRNYGRGYRYGGVRRYGGYRGYRYYGRGYRYNNYWAAPAGAFIAGALVGGAIANNGYYYGEGYYGGGYYPGDYYAGDIYRRRVYYPPRSSYRQGYADGYRAGYNDRTYGGGLTCTPRMADAGNC